MSLSEDFLLTDDLHPIDIVETLAEHHDWEFDRSPTTRSPWRLRGSGAPIP